MVVAPEIVQRQSPHPDQITLEGNLSITLGLLPDMDEANPDAPEQEREANPERMP